MLETTVAKHVAEASEGYQIREGEFFDRVLLTGPGIQQPINLYELTRSTREMGVSAECSFSDGVTLSISPRNPRAALLSFTAPDGVAVPKPLVCASWSIREDGDRTRILGFDFKLLDEAGFARQAEIVRLGLGVHHALKALDNRTAQMPIEGMVLTRRSSDGDILSHNGRPIFINFQKFEQNDFVHFLDTSSECLSMLGKLVRAVAPQRFSIDLEMGTMRQTGIEKEIKLSELTRASRSNEMQSSLELGDGLRLFVTPRELGSAYVSFCTDNSNLCQHEVPEPVVCGIVPVAKDSGVMLDFDRCIVRPVAELPTEERLVDLAWRLDQTIKILNREARLGGVNDFSTIATPVDSLSLCVRAATALYRGGKLVYETGGRKAIFPDLSEPCLHDLRELVAVIQRTHEAAPS